ncbi:hypothetical protein [Pseudomonas sp. GXM4]|jgi:hypothetical protein|uniref:hypothetical protein n=1 Tax=Pseudomonas sp. GXM4 TaxID=2651867 RepID=UPI001F154BCB|nr:hypothetical protein [Pseudomonas sp. GXM4]
MTPNTRPVLAVLGLMVFYAGLWVASEWWERAFATAYRAADISPDGCVRVQAFRPYWVLPASFHPKSPPDDPDDRSWFVRWESPAFFRLYDQRDGRLLGETDVYDLVNWGGPVNWGYGKYREVSVGMIQIGTEPDDCKYE